MKMTLSEYQEKAATTALYPKEQGMAYTVLGLNGEAGELADKYKKVIRDSQGKMSDETRLAMSKELGDVLWYVAMCAKELGSDLETIAQMNLDKLFSRQKRGQIQGAGDNR